MLTHSVVQSFLDDENDSRVPSTLLRESLKTQIAAHITARVAQITNRIIFDMPSEYEIWRGRIRTQCSVDTYRA